MQFLVLCAWVSASTIEYIPKFPILLCCLAHYMNRKIVFFSIMLLMVLGVTEVASIFTYRLLFGGLTFQDLTAAPDPADGDEPEQADDPQKKLLHPYVGYVKARTYNGLYPSLAEQKSVGEVWVLIVGGSVAAGLERWDHFRDVFNRHLSKKSPSLQVRTFIGASGGYKQPQQLLQVSYLLALGTPIDIVINVDGYNDIVLPYLDNARRGVDPFFPRGWGRDIAVSEDDLDLLALGRIAMWRARQRSISDFVSTNLLGKLGTVRLIGAIWYSYAQREIVSLDAELSKTKEKEINAQQRGPLRPHRGRDDIMLESAEVWARSSSLLADLLKRQGKEYFHFLQPNQYAEGGKPLSSIERKHFFRPNKPAGLSARHGYPILQELAHEMLVGRLHYFDATDLFKKETDTMYVDPCCHFNEEGNLALVEFIVGTIIQHSDLLNDGDSTADGEAETSAAIDG